jgi:dephospho-CoA kinase
VACSTRQQIVRLERRGLSPELAEQRISKQLPLARKIELADKVLWNDGTVSFLQAQIDVVVDSLPNVPIFNPSSA